MPKNYINLSICSTQVKHRLQSTEFSMCHRLRLASSPSLVIRRSCVERSNTASNICTVSVHIPQSSEDSSVTPSSTASLDCFVSCVCSDFVIFRHVNRSCYYIIIIITVNDEDKGSKDTDNHPPTTHQDNNTPLCTKTPTRINKIHKNKEAKIIHR